MSEAFYDWLARKYGWGREIFEGLSKEFQESLIREYVSIRASYGG